MRTDPVTNRWADALFNLAERNGALDDVKSDVERIGAEVQSPAVRSFLFNAQVGRAEKLAKIQPLLDGFHALTQNFVKLLFDKNREEVLRGLADAFQVRTLSREGAVEGVVESARKLDSDQVEKLAASLGQRIGKTVRLTNRENPELMSGVRVFVGARMIDFSVQGRLEGLRRRMMDAPLSAGTA